MPPVPPDVGHCDHDNVTPCQNSGCSTDRAVHPPARHGGGRLVEAPITVFGLTRFYGTQRGVIALTFDVQEGEILGFLGPNGAGKTTTIRLLRPGSGAARIFGL